MVQIHPSLLSFLKNSVPEQHYSLIPATITAPIRPATATHPGGDFAVAGGEDFAVQLVFGATWLSRALLKPGHGST